MRKQTAVRESIATWWRIHPFEMRVEPVEVAAFTGSFVTRLEANWQKTAKSERPISREGYFSHVRGSEGCDGSAI